MPPLETGVERLLRTVPPDLRNARVALLTHAAGVDAAGRNTADLLAAHPDLRLQRLFAPEHGLRGQHPAGEAIDDTVDRPTGVPVFSFYGRRPPGSPEAREAFADLDAVLVDLQDIGCRYFTYPGTMRRVLKASVAAGVPVWVCDRPNPLGRACAGPVGVPAGLRSLVGTFDVPVRHGRTIGELALVAAAEEGLPEDMVRVLPATGWRRADDFAAWGRPWVPPSPNSTGPEMAELYPGTCLFEGTNVSEGRGTPYPFRQIGAPWWDGLTLARRLTERLPSGVTARATWFLPTAGKHAGTVCQGVFLDLDPTVARAPDAGLVAAVALLCLAGEDDGFSLVQHGGVHWLDRLTGGAALRARLADWASLRELLAAWREASAEYEQNCPVKLYPE